MELEAIRTSLFEIFPGLKPVEIDREASILKTYIDLLSRWNERINLVSRSSDNTLEEHLIDSLYIARALPRATTVVDVGSGAGFPGVVIAALCSETRVLLCEPKQKSSSFLKEVRMKTALSNLEVFDSPIEELSPVELTLKPGDILVSRAFSPADKLLGLARAFLKDGYSLFIPGTSESVFLEHLAASNELISKNAYHPAHSEKLLFQIASSETQ